MPKARAGSSHAGSGTDEAASKGTRSIAPFGLAHRSEWVTVVQAELPGVLGENVVVVTARTVASFSCPSPPLAKGGSEDEGIRAPRGPGRGDVSLGPPPLGMEGGNTRERLLLLRSLYCINGHASWDVLGLCCDLDGLDSRGGLLQQRGEEGGRKRCRALLAACCCCLSAVAPACPLLPYYSCIMTHPPAATSGAGGALSVEAPQ